MQFKARFLRFLHLTRYLFTHKPHQAITITNSHTFCKIPFYIKTKYVGCICDKEWLKKDLSTNELSILETFKHSIAIEKLNELIKR